MAVDAEKVVYSLGTKLLCIHVATEGDLHFFPLSLLFTSFPSLPSLPPSLPVG